MELTKDNFMKHYGIRLAIYSYLDGATLYHKIAILDKATRKILPGSGILD